MPLVTALPAPLENGEALIARRNKAKERKDLWRSLLQDSYQHAMPSRETFTWQTEGAYKTRELYDSTLQEATYTAANTLVAILFPPWSRWAELSPGAAIPQAEITPEITAGLQDATETFFGFLNSSNFAEVIGEVALDLQVGTGALDFDEGDDENPFVFTSIPLSAIEIEEGPNGKVETTFMCRKPRARNLTRMYKGMELLDLPADLVESIEREPDKEIEIIQGQVFYPGNRRYYGVAVHQASKEIIWRFDYGPSSPTIVARATKVAGEIYGRGRVMLALPDAKSLNKMQEFVLRHSALQIAPPMTGLSDGVLNPYTAVLAPNTILPVASNANGNPSLRVLEFGGNFSISDKIMTDLRERVRRTMLGPDMSESAIKSATEISISDRNRLWAMGGEYGRIQAELLAKIIARGVFILQNRGLIPRFEVDGRVVAIKYTSPFAKSQAAEDITALQRTLTIASLTGPEVVQLGLKVEDMPAWVARKEGVDEKLIRNDAERQQVVQQGAQIAAATQQAEQGAETAA